MTSPGGLSRARGTFGNPRAWLLAGSFAWLAWSVWLPETLPLYGLHVTNVKLDREIREVRWEIARLERERESFRRIRAALAGDAVYWEAVARRAGLTRTGETVVRVRGD